MPLTVPETIYLGLVLAGGTYALVRTLGFLGVIRRVRIQAIERRRRFEAVQTKSPLRDPKGVALERGIESVEKQFSVLRRLLVPLIVLMTLLLIAPTLLTQTSATTASVIGAVVAAVLGLALRPMLENAVAGLVISSSQLVRIGDTVHIDEWYGTIEDITATHTTLKVWDWRRYLVPNGRMLQSAFVNDSLFDTFQWAHVEFWVAPDADLALVEEIAVRAPLESSHFSHREEPKFWVIDIQKDAIQCWVAAWADTPSAAWSLKNDVRTTILRELRRHGVRPSLQHHAWSRERSSELSAGDPSKAS